MKRAEPDKGGLCGAQYQNGDLPRVEEERSQQTQSIQEENSRLKRLVADQAVQIHILKEVNARKW
jgi:hypothetical protein